MPSIHFGWRNIIDFSLGNESRSGSPRFLKFINFLRSRASSLIAPRGTLTDGIERHHSHNSPRGARLVRYEHRSPALVVLLRHGRQRGSGQPTRCLRPSVFANASTQAATYAPPLTAARRRSASPAVSSARANALKPGNRLPRFEKHWHQILTTPF